ncbi:VgrG-related protein [Paenibacillus segetis]|uniref:Peptidase C39-like domain-containing protein n=1 Tax=Paenibacillus segetis TaxID=1325360 RepID=A0ABQ1Y3Y7_9BACL|nr:C39 family peptidase [Paenibacillus segetis]GGH11066.1 hypothetical protein GCM10008013_02740 [Paenibacillus segetis]
MKIEVDPSKLEELSAELKSLARTIENGEKAIYPVLTRLIGDTQSEYPESYVQSMVREMEDCLKEIHSLAESVSIGFGKKASTLNEAAEYYRGDENEAKKLAQVKALPSSFYNQGVYLYGEELTTYLQDRLFEDPTVQKLHLQAKDGTEEEQLEAKDKLDAIFRARDTIARAQVAYSVYKAFGNVYLMENAHKEAIKQREILKGYGVNEDLYGQKVNLSHLYSGTTIQACSYDPSFQLTKDGKFVQVPMPDDNQYQYLLGLVVKGGTQGAWAHKQLEEIHKLLSEIGRAQVAWSEYKAKGMQKEMDGAHAYAEKVRAELKNKYSMSPEMVDDVDYKHLWTGTGFAGNQLKKVDKNETSSGINIDSKNKDFQLGLLSRKFESNGKPGTISGGGGDSGGASYGAYQFASKFDIPLAFVKWLKNQNENYFKSLSKAYEQDGDKYGANFNQVWSTIAKDDPEGFLKLQHDYVKTTYYDVTVKKLKDSIGFDVSLHSDTLKDVIWSRSVHHGAGGAANMIQEAFKSLDYKHATEEQLIRAIYKESGKVIDSGTKSITEKNLNKPSNNSSIKVAKEHGIYGKYLKYFSKNSTEVQVSVWTRININELNDALALLKKEEESNTKKNQQTQVPTNPKSTNLGSYKSVASVGISKWTTVPNLESMPIFSQDRYLDGTKPSWYDEKLGNSKDTKIYEAGCTLTAIAMVESWKRGEVINPSQLNKELKDKKVFSGASLMMESIPNIEFDRHMGNEALFKETTNSFKSVEILYNYAKKSIDSGNPVLIDITETKYQLDAPSRHWVLAVGYDEGTKDMLIINPAGGEVVSLKSLFENGSAKRNKYKGWVVADYNELYNKR